MGKIEDIRTGFEKAYIDGNVVSNNYTPSFISNNINRKTKVSAAIEAELLKCDKFQISVAFITHGGIERFLQIFRELESKNIPGEILTTNYLDFSEPKALKILHEFKNIHLKMYDVGNDKSGLHTKGYIFQKEEIYNIIIGSSNWTGNALSSNKEWNTKIISTANGQVAKDILEEFDELWNSDKALEYDEFFELYNERYQTIKKHQNVIKNADDIVPIKDYELKPNRMQTEFINNLKKLIEAGEKKALLISATGTGKTFASAFAMQNLEYKRVLFLVHRNQLASQTLKSYKRIFKNTVTYGIVCGGKAEYDRDYIFATVQTIGKEDNYKQFAPDHFDAIILDEAHHSTANMYQNIISYFTPKLFLGMTATPDKRDDALDDKNVYEVFEHNIAQEIRLEKAMEFDLLCPFHYFGVSDSHDLDDKTVLSKEINNRNLEILTCDERVNYIIEQANFFGYSGDKVMGLIFCSRRDEARALSEKFNNTINPETGKKFKTIYLDGDTKDSVREESFEKLASEDENDYLDYIFSVEILNEGVDIVEVNQVIMLRPTQSPIVFIQQLGRGLRKAENKEFVVILDFIGNYNSNFMIPIALSGDRTYNKDNIRKYVAEGNCEIPGQSSVHFDEISRNRIYKSIDNANTNSKRLLKQEYINLKDKLGRVPTIADFYENGTIEINKYFKVFGSYYSFLNNYFPDDRPCALNEIEEEIICFISNQVVMSKRLQDMIILKELIDNKAHVITYIDIFIKEFTNINFSNELLSSVYRNLSNQFLTDNCKKYLNTKLIKKNPNKYELDDDFKDLLLVNPIFKNMIEELLDYGINYVKINYRNMYKNYNLELYNKYTYEDVSRLLNWEQNNSSVMNGYFFHEATKTLPVFINYEKSSDAIKYKDRFVNHNTIIASSKKNEKENSKYAKRIYGLVPDADEIKVLLFVRKDKKAGADSKEFYFLGEIHAEGKPAKTTIKKKDDAIEITYKLEEPVRDDIYNYIINEG